MTRPSTDRCEYLNFLVQILVPRLNYRYGVARRRPAAPARRLRLCSFLPPAFSNNSSPTGNGLTYSLVDFLTGLVLAKKLFAHKEHSYTKAIALNVLVVSLTRTYFLAILYRIATQRHSRAVAIARNPLVLAQALLDYPDHVRFGKELIRSPLDVPLGEFDRPLERLFFRQFARQITSPDRLRGLSSRRRSQTQLRVRVAGHPIERIRLSLEFTHKAGQRLIYLVDTLLLSYFHTQKGSGATITTG